MKNLILAEIKRFWDKDIILEKPRDRNLAHYASPVAFSLAKELKTSPKIVAQDICAKFEKSEIFSEISTLNGYVNFKISSEFLDKIATKSLKDPQNFAKSPKNNEKILVEFVSANPTGPLHIGHVRGAVFGDSLIRVGKHLGFEIMGEYYINDAGNQIDLLGISIILRAKELIFNEKVEYPQKFYRGEYIDWLVNLANETFSKEIFYNESCFEKLCLWAKDEILKLIKQDLQNANISIQNWVSERTFYDKLGVTIDKLKQNGAVYEKDGKIWIASSKFGDDSDRVVIRQDGRATYLASDIVYHSNKFERKFDRCIDIWGADHHGYIKRMSAALHFLGHDESKFEVILMQMVSLLKNGESFKMSKRDGTAILMSEILSEIGADALRFMFISRKNDTHLEFDIDELKKCDSSNPIFYINYAHARIHQIFVKANKNIADILDIRLLNLSKDARNLLFFALSLNDILQDAFACRQLQKISDYLYNLAADFHKFYNENRVIGAQNEDELLKLFAVVALSIRTGLSVIGISAKNKMQH